MRIGLLGPADGDTDLLREAAEFLLGDCGVDEAVYLGNDDTAEKVAGTWAEQVMGGPATENAFLTEAARLALHGESGAIDELLSKDEELRRLSAIRCLPPPPARAVEVIDERVVLFVNDKALLDEEDIANAFLIVYGRAKETALNRFGPRTFFTPGPLRAGRVAMLEREADGSMALAQFDPATGEPAGREELVGRGVRLVVQS